MVLSSAINFLSGNPAIVWGGIILAALLFLITRHLERMKAQEEELEPPSPSTLDEIVRPKVIRHLQDRGNEPEGSIIFKIGRQKKGEVKLYHDTKMEKDLLNPDPTNQGNNRGGSGETEMEEVRILMTGDTGLLNWLQEFLISILGTYREQENMDNSIYIFRKDSFLNVPGNEMILDPDVLSYELGGCEVEIDDSTRNVVHEAVQNDVNSKLLSALPNYAEKVDYLFPLHSQNITEIKEEGEHLRNEEGF